MFDSAKYWWEACKQLSKKKEEKKSEPMGMGSERFSPNGGEVACGVSASGQLTGGTGQS